MKLFTLRLVLASSILLNSSSFVFANTGNGGAGTGDAATGGGAAVSARTGDAQAGGTQTSDAATGGTEDGDNKTVTKWKPGVELSVGTDTQDLVPTDDPALAKKQVEAYPDSPEASFILAVALTRTSRVEEALKEVRRARKLAEQQGGSAYFDKMIATYEGLLKNFPNENRVRYGLAWAYYMKAYLLANYSKKVAAWKAANGDPNAALAKLQKEQAEKASGNPNTAGNANGSGNPKTAGTASASAASAGSGTANAGTAVNTGASANPSTKTEEQKQIEAAKSNIAQTVKSGKPLDLGAIVNTVGALAQGNTKALPKIPSITDNVDPADLPQIRKYYELALTKLDELLTQKPDDVWAIVYRAHLKAEYSGNLDEAMSTWIACRDKFPNNPAAYFFLGEGYLKQGNLKESLNNVSRAVALRAMGY